MFKVGDKVGIDVDHIPNTTVPIKRGTTGRVVGVANHKHHKLSYAVSYCDGTYWFGESHLSPKDGHNKMPEPLFDLDDMELAEILMEELREK